MVARSSEPPPPPPDFPLGGALTFTVAEALPVPPPPVQLSANVVAVVSADVVTVPPLGSSVPDQPEPPEAVQAVAF